MKITKIKNRKGGFSYKIYKDKLNNNYECALFEDGSGHYIVKNKRRMLKYREDGNLNIWLNDINKEIQDLMELESFLREVEEKINE